MAFSSLRSLKRIVVLRTADGNCPEKDGSQTAGAVFCHHGNHPILLSVLRRPFEHGRAFAARGIDPLSEVRHPLHVAPISGRF